MSGCKKNSELAISGFTPLSSGTNWTYLSTYQGTSSTLKLTLTNKDTTVNGNSYKVVNSSSGTNFCFGVRNGDYYRVGILPATIISNFEELYLKDNITTATTWSQTTKVTYGGTTADLQMNYKVGELGVSKTIAGKTYNNVVEVKLEINAVVAPLSLGLGTGSFYYAQGIGLISYNVTVNTVAGFISGFTQQLELQSYEIK